MAKDEPAFKIIFTWFDDSETAEVRFAFLASCYCGWKSEQGDWESVTKQAGEHVETEHVWS